MDYFPRHIQTAVAFGYLIARESAMRIMPVTPEYRDFVEDMVEPLGHVTTRRMFGGLGVFYRGLMFALIVNCLLYTSPSPRDRG